MPEANVLYSVTAAVVVGLVVWVAFVLKTAKQPWARETPALARAADVPVEPVEPVETRAVETEASRVSSASPEADAPAAASAAAATADVGARDAEADADADAKRDEATAGASKADASK